MIQVKYRKIKKYSGPLIYGKYNPPEQENIVNHCRRAVLLTEGVETGYRVGSVMAADGTGMTAGKGQHILVYPRELANEDFNPVDDQGGLGALLRMIEKEAPNEALNYLFERFRNEGWYVASDGKFRWLKDTRVKIKGKWLNCKAGSIVHGAVLRNTMTPPTNGRVPKESGYWERSKQWARFFYDVFSDPSTFEVQTSFEVAHLVNRINHRKYSFHKGRRKETLLQAVYGGVSNVETLEVGYSNDKWTSISSELDLAMCVFHSHSVNAPAIAYRKLKETFGAWRFVPMKHRGTTVETLFARELLKRLATAKYGRWNEDVKGGRWARTRHYAIQMKVWPVSFFRGQSPIMPIKF